MRRFGIKVLVICLGLLGVLKAFETRLTFPLDATPILPEQVGLHGVKRLVFETNDGENVVAWHHPAPPGAPTILYFQGNAGNLGSRAQRFERFRQNGFGWTALGYRGSSGSTAGPSEKTLMADAVQLVELLHQSTPKPTLIYYGESLGTGIAAQLAITHPPEKLVLEAPYRRIPDAAVYGIAPNSLAVLFKNQFNTLDHITRVDSPLLILHGTDDQTIPFSHGEAVFAASASADKTLLRLDGVGHHNVWTAPAQEALWRFLNTP